MGRNYTVKLGQKPTWKQRLRDWLNSDQYNIDVGISDIESRSLESTEPLRFSVYRANGGMVIETRMYDHKKDQNNNQLHIITDDKDLGKEIGRIITMEVLRNG